jgi:hypothetical protein
MPFQQMRPNITPMGLGVNARVPRYDGHIWVPIDDEETWVYNWMCGFDDNSPLDPDYVEELEANYGRGRDDYVPGTHRIKASAENDYFIDRAAQKTTSFTGIKGINTQDMAIQEGMGVIADRAKEYLGTSDRGIVVMRKLLLEATHAVERGAAPPGIDPKSYRDVRPHDGFVPAGADWRAAFAQDWVARW